MPRGRGLAVFVVAPGLMLVLACRDADTPPSWLLHSEIQDPRTLVVGVPDDAATLDGLFAATPRSVEVIMNTNETLMSHGWQETVDGARHWMPDHVIGAALESMTVADDQLTWTLDVRRGVRFPSGREITAETVKHSFDRNFSVKGSGGAFVYRTMGRIPGPESVEVVDSDTLRITTDEPNPLLPRLLILSNSTPQDPELMDEQRRQGDRWAESWLRTNTAGAGAYFLESWTPGVDIILRGNPHYWRGAPAIDKVSMKIIPSAADRVMLLVSGAVDVVERLSAEEIDAVARVPHLKVWSFPSTGAIELVMNNQVTPFDDVRVRRALAYAVPYEAIMRDVYFSRAQPTAGPVPVGFPGHAPGEYPYGQRDVERARTLLVSAGYPAGFSIDLELDSGVPDHEPVAVLLQAALKAVDIQANIVKLTPAVYAERRASKTLALFINENLWWVDDPAYPLLMGYVSTAYLNHSSYADAEVDALIKAAAIELDPQRRLDLLAECQERIIADSPIVWITHPNFNLATRDNIQGYVHFNDEVVRFQYLRKD